MLSSLCMEAPQGDQTPDFIHFPFSLHSPSSIHGSLKRTTGSQCTEMDLIIIIIAGEVHLRMAASPLQPDDVFW